MAAAGGVVFVVIIIINEAVVFAIDFCGARAPDHLIMK